MVTASNVSFSFGRIGILSGIHPVNACKSIFLKIRNECEIIAMEQFTEFDPGKSYPPITFM
jgi:hypothetical protein